MSGKVVKCGECAALTSTDLERFRGEHPPSSQKKKRPCTQHERILGNERGVQKYLVTCDCLPLVSPLRFRSRASRAPRSARCSSCTCLLSSFSRCPNI